MLTQNLKRDGDSAKSHRALGHLLAGLNLHGWPQARRLNPASFSFPFAGRGRLTLRFKPMLLVRGGFHRPGKSGGPPLFEPSLKVKRDDAHNNYGFSVIRLTKQLPEAVRMAMGTSVFRIRIELIFRRCWNLITPWRSAAARSCHIKPPARAPPQVLIRR